MKPSATTSIEWKEKWGPFDPDVEDNSSDGADLNFWKGEVVEQ